MRFCLLHICSSRIFNSYNAQLISSRLLFKISVECSKNVFLWPPTTFNRMIISVWNCSSYGTLSCLILQWYLSSVLIYGYSLSTHVQKTEKYKSYLRRPLWKSADLLWCPGPISQIFHKSYGTLCRAARFGAQQDASLIIVSAAGRWPPSSARSADTS